MVKKVWFNFLTLLSVATPLAALQEVKPVIVFDIHGVLTQVALWKMTKNIFWGLWKQPSLIIKLNPSTFKSGAYAEYPPLRTIYNSHDPRPEMWELVHKLKAAGYPLYIFSNINTASFADFRAELPGYFDIFDGCHIVQDNDPALRKPAATAYDSCKELIAQKHPNRNIIFIDNKKSNIRAAEQAGFTGITFSSMRQLEQELQFVVRVAR